MGQARLPAERPPLRCLDFVRQSPRAPEVGRPLPQLRAGLANTRKVGSRAPTPPLLAKSWLGAGGCGLEVSEVTAASRSRDGAWLSPAPVPAAAATEMGAPTGALLPRVCFPGRGQEGPAGADAGGKRGGRGPASLDRRLAESLEKEGTNGWSLERNVESAKGV